MKKGSSTTGNSEDISDRDIKPAFFDICFYSLGMYAFYKSPISAIAAVLMILILYRFTKMYKRDKNPFYLDSFIDFLNMINSGLSSGLSIDGAIKQSSGELKNEQTYMAQTMKRLSDAIDLGINSDALFGEIENAYPIEESKNFSGMLRQSRRTGSSMSNITEVTLENLYTRFRAVNEARLIIYQKGLEQMILCIAPIMVIFFVQSSADGYLEPMYTTSMGRTVMTFSFGLLVIMKLVGSRIVRGIK